ncbi:carboxypeptidase B-like isoform X1 [Chelonus insularis]|uniref:carboxypeptidase B-like isoform X1 n=1 Tax=Chelonus insularis TaxID=460826 RepID=UPI0015899BA2|nr:carboxypeptidase B-like isoform X1 [Chelonus insularis]
MTPNKNYHTIFLIVFVLISIHLTQSFILPEVEVGSSEPREFDALPIEAGVEISDAVVVKAVEIPEEKITYEGSQVWRVLADREQADFVSYLQETGEVSKWTGNDSTVDVLVRPDMIPRVSRFLRERQVKYDVIIPDLQQAIDQENPLPSQEELEELEGRKARYIWWKQFKLRRKFLIRPYLPLRYPVARIDGDGKGNWQFRGHRMEWTSYHRLEDIHGYLDYLAETFPEICSVMSIGNSFEGRPLKVLRISKGDPNVPAIWIDGGIHAREWISPASVTYIINYLVENSDDLQADYYILPVVNPDGYEYTFRGDRLWRKNRSSPEKGGVCIGVDLNRNFGYRWGGLGTSKQPCREIFAGTGPFSEPETAAIKNFFEASAANFKAYLSFHSYGQYILYPWGYDRRVPPDYADLERVGQQSALAMKSAGGVGSVYTVGNSATTLYAASGGSDDWAKAVLKVKYAYTIELRDTGKSGFILPARYIIPTAKEALAAVLTVTEACKKL